jgi:alpha-N-acetylglucosamine transferase
MRWSMTDRTQLSELYKQNLEKDIIRILSETRGIDIRTSFNIYYSSKLAEQIENGDYGIENMDAKYLAEDLIENESGLFG